MNEEERQELEDLKEFFKMLDFERGNGSEIWTVENCLYFEDLPATVQEYLKSYFSYIDSIS